MRIRVEVETDYPIVENLIEEAFKEAEYSDHKEHHLVNRLRASNEFIPPLSLVLEKDGQIVGHSLLTKIKINQSGDSTVALTLSPVSVLPAFQNQGIGTALINASLEQAKALGYPGIIVLGHADYYKKFGFVPASTFNIVAPFDVPDAFYMALALNEGALKNIQGTVEYSPAFME